MDKKMEAIEWAVTECEVGPDCWCRCISTVDGDEVLPAGCIDKSFAEYVVALHNKFLKLREVICEIH